MSRNNVMWTLAIALIAVLVLPLANAQAFSVFGYGVSNLKVFLVNAAVIFLVLFLLQAMLVPGKEGKEKTSMWLIIVFASLLISYLYGQAGYLWKVLPLSLIFNYYVIGNAVVIGIVLYFGLGLLKIRERLGSKEGEVGYGIILLLISLFIAVKIGQRWVWSTAILQEAYKFLFV